MKKECKDCKYVELFKGEVEFSKCTSPKATSDYKYCATQRLNPWYFAFVFNTCGKRGRYWEKRDE